MVDYVSTRGNCLPVSFTSALIGGLAPDGGLYLPESYPSLNTADIKSLAGKPYTEVAETLIAPFIGNSIEAHALHTMIEAAYAGFRHKAIAPLRQLDDNLFILELFHGQTLAFKDIAMQLLGRLIDHVLQERSERATIIGATSGDTGAAAIEAFAGLAQIDLFILYPHGRVSDVQRRQMTTVKAENIHTIALEGTFDDAQAIVKGLFNHQSFREETRLSGVNSINFARVLAQTVYYFTAAVSLGAPLRPISFSVPTGNFGDIFAGWIAKKMGLPIERLVIATNSNDILTRSLQSGVYETRSVQATQSPSMDIQISSNFERLLFELDGREPETVRRQMEALAQTGRFTIPAPQLDALNQEFDAFSASEADTTTEMARAWQTSEILIDPHTAVGVHAARQAAANPQIPKIVLGTAHPAKFPIAVKAATGQEPTLPSHLKSLFERQENMTILPNDQKAVANFIHERSRAVPKPSRKVAS